MATENPHVPVQPRLDGSHVYPLPAAGGLGPADENWLPLPEGLHFVAHHRHGQTKLPGGACEDGLGIRVEVSGKAKPVVGDANSPLLADGVSLWLNTRGKASGKRAGAYCYLLHLLPTGGGNERQNPVFLHGKIPRAQAEPHPVGTGQVFFHSCLTPDGYTVSLLIPQGTLTGLDFSENRMLSLLVKIQDSERGPLLSCADIEVNYDEDPNWWDKLQLVDETPPPEKGSVTPQKRQGPDDQAADRPLRKRGRGAIRKAGEDG